MNIQHAWISKTNSVSWCSKGFYDRISYSINEEKGRSATSYGIAGKCVISFEPYLECVYMPKESKCPKCGETRKLRLMLLDTPENRIKEDKDPDGILLVASKVFDGKSTGCTVRTFCVQNSGFLFNTDVFSHTYKSRL